MKRLLIALYGGTAYLCFLIVFISLIVFLGNWNLPIGLHNNTAVDSMGAVLINLGLLGLFGLQHSIMARQRFKTWLTQYVPVSMERSTFIWMTNLVLGLIFWQWQALPSVIWSAQGIFFWLLSGLNWIGWGIVFLSSWLINHFELLGLAQTYRGIRQREAGTQPKFVTPILYQLVRHPMQTGFLMVFWLTPHMTMGRLLFAGGMTMYILIGIHFEERALVQEFGAQYEIYRQTTPKLLPRIRLRSSMRSTIAEKHWNRVNS